VGKLSRTAALLGILLAGVAGSAPAVGKTAFRPRIGTAMGLMPPRGTLDTAVGTNIPVVYHGGSVMAGTVTVHTVFWAPPGYRFGGSPGLGILGYEALIQRFFTDAAHDSGRLSNVFSVLRQYGETGVPGAYSLAYGASADSIDDTDPFPAADAQCPSPAGTGTCVTDSEVQRELDHVIQTRDPGGYGLHDMWLLFLPPNVDECVNAGSCGTNAFAGYHSLADEGHGEFIYAVMIDTLIEAQPVPGADPEGNPDAENTIDTAAHEAVEAITDPEGVGWMDPNGFEVADKCEAGPQWGTPLGYAPDGAPYNQVIGGHEYAVQEMWSNPAGACVQSSAATADGLPLPRISLRQFSPAVSGRIGAPTPGVVVHVGIVRGGDLVADAVTRTRADGTWGPIDLRSARGALHGVGDDRDVILVDYGRGGPPDDLILTGAGGNPYTEAGWTSWADLDTGFAVRSRSVSIAPCGQTGVLTVTVNGRPTAPLLPECQNETDATTVSAPRITPASRVLMTSADNRAASPVAPSGAQVALTVALGEPGSVAQVNNAQVPFAQSGLPACTADLRRQVAECSGLVPFARYTLTRLRRGVAVRARAGFDGVARFGRMRGSAGIRGGDVLRLTNSARRVLTTLHVARLRAAIDGDQTVLAGGTCQPGEYWGAPLRLPPPSPAIGVPGATGRGTVCPASGRARGLPSAVIAQPDDRSGGLTQTSVPLLTGEAPSLDATVYGPFRALAQTGVPGPHGSVLPAGARVSVAFTRVGTRRAAFRSANVAGARGVAVRGLAAGVYRAVWVVRDLNGDTRTVVTRFVQAG
jgi:hypothetical protein